MYYLSLHDSFLRKGFKLFCPGKCKREDFVLIRSFLNRNTASEIQSIEKHDKRLEFIVGYFQDGA